MKAAVRGFTWREVRCALRECGARPARVKGSHEVWRFEDGGTFVVLRNHLGRAVPVGLLTSLRRLFASRLANADEEPPPFGRMRSR